MITSIKLQLFILCVLINNVDLFSMERKSRAKQRIVLLCQFNCESTVHLLFNGEMSIYVSIVTLDVAAVPGGVLLPYTIRYQQAASTELKELSKHVQRCPSAAHRK